MAEAPGGETGLLTKKLKVIGFGENAELVAEYSVDTGLLKELRAHEEQAARELGQWADKTEISGPGGGPVQLEARLIAGRKRVSDARGS
jgi:hypothetical protein